MTAAPIPVVDLSGCRCDRWRRPGHDRLYVNVPSATGTRRVGYRDLLTGDDHPTSPQDLSVLVLVADHWEVRRGAPAPGTARPA